MWNVQEPVLRGQERVQLLSSQHPKVSLSEFLGNSRSTAVCHAFSVYILRNHSLHLPARGSARSPVIINLFWPNEDEMLTQSSKVKLYIVFRRVPQRRSWMCACLCVE